MSDTPVASKESSGWWPTLGTPLAVLLCLLGLATSGVLLQHHLAVKIGSNPLLGGVCAMTQHSSCDAVLRSQWAHFPGQSYRFLPRRPTALWGFYFFAAMFSWYAMIGRPSPERKLWHLVPLIASAAATGICAGLAFLMYTQLPEWCPLCAATHIITALLFVVTALMWPRLARVPQRPATTEGQETKIEPESLAYATAPFKGLHGRGHFEMFRSLVIALLLAVAIGWAASSSFYERLNEAAAIDYKNRWQLYENDLQLVYNRYMSQPKVEIPVGPDDSVRGPATAPHTVVLFGDLQCEYCRGVDKMIRQKEEENPGMMRVVFKHFPMNNQCNEYVKSRVHAAACAAAVTTEAARKLGGEDMFWKMHDELFSHQASFARRPQQYLDEACKRLGLDKNTLMSTIQTRAVWSRVAQHTAQGHAVNVDMVPAIFLDGRRMDSWALSKFWDYIFEGDRARDKSLSPAKSRATSAPAGGSATTRPGAN